MANIRENTSELTEVLELLANKASVGGDYNKGVEDGKQQAYDTFWDAFQENGNRQLYVQAFVRQGWTDVTYNPKYPIIGYTYGIQELFSNAFIVDTKVPITVRAGGTIKAAFNMCTRLKRVRSLILEVPITDTMNAFNNCVSLEEINIECKEGGCFATSLNLQHSSKLTNASVQTIINALKDLTGATAQTLTFHATVGGKLTEEQKAAISAKNWTLVY